MMISTCPARRTPLLMGDFNGKLGLARTQSDVDQNWIGPYNKGLENDTTEFVRETMQIHEMAAANTFFAEAAGDTFFGSRGRSSRIDFLFFPKALLELVQKSRYGRGSLEHTRPSKT